jgi:hypothetical protein
VVSRSWWSVPKTNREDARWHVTWYLRNGSGGEAWPAAGVWADDAADLALGRGGRWRLELGRGGRWRSELGRSQEELDWEDLFLGGGKREMYQSKNAAPSNSHPSAAAREHA